MSLQTSDKENYYCANCGSLAPLSSNLRCDRCGSDQVISQSRIVEITSLGRVTTSARSASLPAIGLGTLESPYKTKLVNRRLYYVVLGSFYATVLAIDEEDARATASRPTTTWQFQETFQRSSEFLVREVSREEHQRMLWDEPFVDS